MKTLESTETDLEDSQLDKYNRMIQLNHYIQEKFKEKIS